MHDIIWKLNGMIQPMTEHQSPGHAKLKFNKLPPSHIIQLIIFRVYKSLAYHD